MDDINAKAYQQRIDTYFRVKNTLKFLAITNISIIC